MNFYLVSEPRRWKRIKKINIEMRHVGRRLMAGKQLLFQWRFEINVLGRTVCYNHHWCIYAFIPSYCCYAILYSVYLYMYYSMYYRHSSTIAVKVAMSLNFQNYSCYIIVIFAFFIIMAALWSKIINGWPSWSVILCFVVWELFFNKWPQCSSGREVRICLYSYLGRPQSNYIFICCSGEP